METKKIYALILICGIAIGLLIPVLILTIPAHTPDTKPPSLQVLSPINATAISPTASIRIDINCSDTDVDTIWYRIYNNTDSTWVDPTNLTWTTPCWKTLGKGAVYTLYAWANDTSGNKVHSPTSVIFTLIHQFTYAGDHTFSSSLIVGKYQQVIFIAGTFTFTNGSLEVIGSLGMLNAIFHGDLTAQGQVILQNATIQSSLTFTGMATSVISNSVINCAITGYDAANILIDHSRIADLGSYMNALISVSDSVTGDIYLLGNSSIVFTNLTMNSLTTYGNINVHLNAVPHSASAWILNQNSTVSVTNSNIGQAVYLHDFATLTVTNSSLSVRAEHYTKVNLTHCQNCPIELSTYVQGTFTNFTSDQSFSLFGNSHATLINSTLTTLYQYPTFYSGTWTINHQIPSGTGNADLPTYTLDNAAIYTIQDYISVEGSTNYTNLSINNSKYYILTAFDHTNVTLNNVTLTLLDFRDGNVKGSIVNSTISSISLYNNDTVYLENVAISTYLEKRYNFIEGDVTGYNDTFTGAEKWAYPKVTVGPNVFWNYLRYSYYASSHVNLTITQTPSIANVYAYQNANITLYYCHCISIISYSFSNVTVSNTTTNIIYLHENSFGAVINSSHVFDLFQYESSHYYISPDSTVDNKH